MPHKFLRTTVWSLSIVLVSLGALAANILMFNALEPLVGRLHVATGPLSWVLLEFCFVLALWTFTIVLHEGGHLLAARLQGMTISEVKLGWFVFTPRWRGYKFEFRRRGSMFGGMVKVTVGSRSVRREMILFVLGGPAMNLGCGILLGSLTWLAFVRGSVTLAGAIFALALANAYMGLANFLPIGRRIPSDGSRLYHWIFKGNKDLETLALLRLMGLSVKGLRARDYTPGTCSFLKTHPCHCVVSLAAGCRCAEPWIVATLKRPSQSTTDIARHAHRFPTPSSRAWPAHGRYP